MDEVIVFYYPVTDPAHHPRGTMDPQTLTTVGTGAVLLAAIIGALTYARQSSRDLRTDLKTDINQARVELKADINQIRTDLKTDINQARNEALLHDSTAARVGALFQLLVQDTTAQDFGLPSSAIRLRM